MRLLKMQINANKVVAAAVRGIKEEIFPVKNSKNTGKAAKNEVKM